MSVYNINSVFTASIADGASNRIEYVRYYNFTENTATQVPIDMTNSDTETPITVDITTTFDWIKVLDPQGNSIKLPDSNIVIEANSTKRAIVIVDLPAELETTDTKDNESITEKIKLKLRAGSFPLKNTTTKVANTIKFSGYAPGDILILKKGTSATLYISVYDNSGMLDETTAENWTSGDRLVFTVVESSTQVDADVLARSRIIQAVNIGEAELSVESGLATATLRVKVVENDETTVIPTTTTITTIIPPITPPGGIPGPDDETTNTGTPGGGAGPDDENQKLQP